MTTNSYNCVLKLSPGTDTTSREMASVAISPTAARTADIKPPSTSVPTPPRTASPDNKAGESFNNYSIGSQNGSIQLPNPLAPCTRKEHWLLTRGGQRLNIIRWVPAVAVPGRIPKAVVFVAHAYKSFANELFDWISAVLSARDIACAAIEHMGHGKSEGQRGFVPRFDTLVDDFVDAAVVLQSKFYKGLPMFSYGCVRLPIVDVCVRARFEVVRWSYGSERVRLRICISA